jgi:uncharacterized protein (TIGR00369 family)
MTVERYTRLQEDGPLAGWRTWRQREQKTFSSNIGQIWWRDEADGSVTIRMETGPEHINQAGALHGGFIMSFADMALYAVAWRQLNGFVAVTLTCNSEFLAAGAPGVPLIARCDLLKSEGKVLFIRGLIHQEDKVVAAFSGSLRRMARR